MRAFAQQYDLDGLQQNTMTAHVEIGAKLNSLDTQEENNSDLSYQLKATLSSVRDTDYVTAIAQLQQQTMMFEAAQASFSRISQSSLFDYL